MIQAGTISTGSACTSAVAGAYWMSSIEAVAQHHLAGGDGHVAADDEVLGAGGRGAADQALEVLDGVDGAAHEVHAAARLRLAQHHRVGGQEVARREHVEELARGEGDDLLVVARHAGHAVGGGVPPLLAEQEGLVHEVEGPRVPLGRLEAAVLRGRLDAFVRGAARRGDGELLRVTQQAARLLDAEVCELHALARRQREVAGPVHRGQQQRDRRHRGGGARDGRVHPPIERVARRWRGEGFGEAARGVSGGTGERFRRLRGRRGGGARGGCACAGRVRARTACRFAGRAGGRLVHRLAPRARRRGLPGGRLGGGWTHLHSPFARVQFCIVPMVWRRRWCARVRKTAPIAATIAKAGHTTSTPAPRKRMACASDT